LRPLKAGAGVGTAVQGVSGHTTAGGGDERARGSPVSGSPRTGSRYGFAR
jgi:hypothetical protein